MDRRTDRSIAYYHCPLWHNNSIINYLIAQFINMRDFIVKTLCVFCAFVFHTAYMLCYCQHSGVDLVGLKPSP